MNRRRTPGLALSLLLTFAASALAAPAVDFSGRWRFAPAKSQNVAMMAGLEIHAVIEQTAAALVVHERSRYDGRDSDREIRYDLNGQPIANRSAMGDPSETVTHWDAAKLVTTWTGASAVAGSKVVRTETRSLTTGGQEMVVESARGTAPPIVMVYVRE